MLGTWIDGLQLVDVANEFVSRNDNRQCNFGTFTEADFHHLFV